MNPEAIIVFVVLIAVNALFSKNKAQKQQQRRNQQNRKQKRPEQHGPDQQRSGQQRSKKDSEESGGYGLNQRRTEPSSERKETARPQRQRQRPRSLLEEVLQQYNINEDKDSYENEIKSTEEIPAKAKETVDSEEHYTDYSKRDQPQKSRKKKELKGYSKSRKKSVKVGVAIGDVIGAGSVENGEIGTEGFDKLLKFDQRSLVQGIVMAEILDKPKATRKKRTI